MEYEQDYGVAVEEGRKAAQSDPNCFFIDDENSRTLFLGYSVAGQRLKAQFAQQGRIVDADNPLFVYLPCGVGGGPGGVAFGLKLAFGDHVHCFFAEPTHSPCMLLGVHTGLHDQISVQDIGIDNLTAADGLAVGRASGFVGRAMERLLDGFYTLSDQTMYDMLGWLAQEEGIRLEPSALAGMAGSQRVCASVSYQQMHGFSAEQLRNATHLVWATGGGMVPEEEMNQYLAKAVNNVSTQHRHPFLVSDAADDADLRFCRFTCYSLLFFHHPTPFAVNGGFANQTKTVSKIKAIAAIRKISFAEIESDC